MFCMLFEEISVLFQIVSWFPFAKAPMLDSRSILSSLAKYAYAEG